MVSEKKRKIPTAFGIHKIYEQNPLENFFIYLIYQNYTSALNNVFNISYYLA